MPPINQPIINCSIILTLTFIFATLFKLLDSITSTNKPNVKYYIKIGIAIILSIAYISICTYANKIMLQ